MKIVRSLVLASLFLPLFSTSALFAEELKGTENALALEILKATLSQERAKAFEGAMKDVPPEDQRKFWELYRTYADQKAVFDERRFKLMDQYMTNYLLLTPEQTRELMDRWIGLQEDELKARIKMFKLLSKKVSALVGTRFYQVDDYVYAALKIQYMSRYPIFGDKPN